MNSDRGSEYDGCISEASKYDHRCIPDHWDRSIPNTVQRSDEEACKSSMLPVS